MDKIANKETEVFGGGTLGQENNITALRILACIMVISIHVSEAHAVKQEFYIKNFNFLLANLWYGLSCSAVPLFVMISGRYALNRKNSEYKKYYVKIFKKIYIPAIFWSVFYMILRYYFQNISIKKIINATIGGAPFYHLWYLYMMIGIYLLVPFLVKLKEKMKEKNFEKLGILLVIISFIMVIFRDFSSLANIGLLKYYWKFNQFKFINYLGYFILGYSLKKIKINKKVKRYFLIISIIFIFISLFFFKDKYILIYDTNYIWMVFYSISIYLFFLDIKINKYKSLSFLEKYNFDIYLIHPIILNFILEKFRLQEKVLWLKIPFLITITFIFSLLLALVLNIIIKKIKNKIKI